MDIPTIRIYTYIYQCLITVVSILCGRVLNAHYEFEKENKILTHAFLHATCQTFSLNTARRRGNWSFCNNLNEVASHIGMNNSCGSFEVCLFIKR